MADIQLCDLPGSPDSMKVRLALGYKGIPYEQRSIDGGDDSRAEVMHPAVAFYSSRPTGASGEALNVAPDVRLLL